MTDTTDIHELVRDNAKNIERLADALDAEREIEREIGPSGPSGRDKAAFFGFPTEEKSAPDTDELAADEQSAALMLQNAQNIRALTREVADGRPADTETSEQTAKLLGLK